MATKAKPKTSGRTITISRIEFEYLQVHLIGDTPLLQNRFSQESQEVITNLHTREDVGAKAPLDPEAKFKSAMHPVINGHFTHPAIAFKEAAVDEVRQANTSLTMVAAISAFHLFGEDTHNKEYAFIKGCVPQCRFDIGTPNKVPIPIFRPEYKEWWTTLVIQCRRNGLLSVNLVANLLNGAGNSVGVGSHRVTKRGVNGMFHVASAEEIKSRFKDCGLE